MKKIIAILGMTISLTMLANVENDFQQAIVLLNLGKKSEAVKALQKIRPNKGEEGKMSRVYFALYELSNNNKDRIKYLKLASRDKKSNDRFAVSANEILAANEKDINKQLILIKELNTRTKYTNILYIEKEAFALYRLNKAEEVAKLNSFVDKNETLENRKDYYFGLMNSLYSIKKYQEATELANKALKLDSDDKVYISDIYVALSNHFNEKEAILPLAYKQIQFAEMTKENRALILGKLFLIAAKAGDEDNEMKYYKKLLDEKVNHVQMAQYLYDKDESLIDKAISYAKKGLKYKEKNARNVLKELESYKKSK
ncbi:hypothetical protein [Oceanivirga salmonicida]|uniref:hypothetical protein n=1 Tax=Oceanivirga salmonicida TaxID=1769291 RepID=UPI0008331C2D|nr:hypothetical protein [Oceanivirga salmonicida]